MRSLFLSASHRKLGVSIKNIFGFHPGNLTLYQLALSHKSAGKKTCTGLKANNERLEFLGDAILDAVVADYLFKTFPTKNEGFLTEMRSKIVSRAQLKKLAQKMGIDQLITIESDNNGNNRTYAGDALEALIGAIYLDQGYDKTKKILLNRVIRHYFDLEELIQQEVSYKSKLIEWSQQERKQIRFDVIDEVGTGYSKQYLVSVSLDGSAIAQAQHYSIKGAEELAAEKTCNQIFPK